MDTCFFVETIVSKALFFFYCFCHGCLITLHFRIVYFTIRTEQVLKLRYNEFNKIQLGREMMRYQKFQRYKNGDEYRINEMTRFKIFYKIF